MTETGDLQTYDEVSYSALLNTQVSKNLSYNYCDILVTCNSLRVALTSFKKLCLSLNFVLYEVMNPARV